MRSVIHVLRILRGQSIDCTLGLLGAGVEDLCAAVDADPPDGGPVVVVMIDQQARTPRLGDVPEPAKSGRGFRLVVDAGIDGIAEYCEYERHNVRNAGCVSRRQVSHPRGFESCSRIVHNHSVSGSRVAQAAADGTVVSWNRMKRFGRSPTGSERSRAETHRVKAYRRAAEVFAGLSDEQKESRRKSDSWKALTGIGPKTAMIIAQSYDGVPEYLEELRGQAEPIGDSPLQQALRGDLHTHSDWSDGGSPIEEMMRRAAALGHDYCALTDHSPRLTVANGLSAERLRSQLDVIAGLNAELAPFRILTGIGGHSRRRFTRPRSIYSTNSTSWWRACTRSCGPNVRR